MLTTTAALLLTAVPAHAGFTLVTPDNNPAAAPPAVPITAVQTAPISNFQTQPTFQAPAFVNNDNVAHPQASPPAMGLPPVTGPNMMPTQTAAMGVTVPATATEPLVKGFGKDIPLVIAAQQIAPPDRQIAFGQGVDPSMPVSWRGGQPWHAVLSNALDKRGLKMSEQGSLLFISQSKAELGMNKASLVMPTKDAAYSIDPAGVNASAMPNAVRPLADSAPMPAANSNVDVTPLPVMKSSTPAPAQVMVLPANPAVTQITPVVYEPAPSNRTTPSNSVAPVPSPNKVQSMPVAAIAAVPTIAGTSISAPLAIPEQNIWHAAAGQTLKQTLEAWSRLAHITLRWDSEYDYPVQASVTMDGDYESAVRSLLRGFSNAQPQPIARLYHPSHGMVGVLLVSDRGNDMSTSQ